MVSSHNFKDYIKFAISYWYISVISTLGLLVYTYWDIIHLRFISGFFGTTDISDQYQDLFVIGLGNSLNSNFFTFLPILASLLLATIVSYTIYETYKDTLFRIDVNHNFVNVKKVNTMNISLHYAVLYSASFIIPLFYWCFYLVVWFPALAKLPLSYILDSSSIKFVLVISLVLLFMIILTQIGLILTRLSIKLFKIS